MLFPACNKVNHVTDDIADNNFLSGFFEVKKEKAKVLDVNFSPDYKTFEVTADILQDVGPYKLEDSTKVRTEVEETIDGFREAHFSTPRLVKIENVEAEYIHEQNISMLVLVDLSLPQADLVHIRDHVKEMKRDFNHDNLFVAFMDGPEVSNTMKATDYVIDRYFVQSTEQYSRLYYSILQKRNEMLQHIGYWQDVDRMVLLIFSNDKVYKDDSDEPIDPNHYLYQEQLAARDSASSDSSFLAYYASFNNKKDVDEEYDNNVLRIFCNNNGGTFIDEFHWEKFKESVFNTLDVVTPDNMFYFENPDYKVYRGDHKKLTLNFYDKVSDTLFLSISTYVVQGEVFKPIIVNGHTIEYIILQGLFLGCFLLIFVYLVWQIIIPFVKYRIFLRKNVTLYKGRNMCIDNKIVEESCYLCKSPFAVGEQIVVKCEHTMHKSCWDENEYHCPEYSDRCKHGSHYYNRANIFDPRNAHYYLKWILVALAASILAWMSFIYYIHQGIESPLYNFAHSSATQIPIFGLSIGLFLTLGISFLTLRPGFDWRALFRIFFRAIIAAIGCYLSFMLVNLVIYLFDINSFTFLLNWIPWTLSGFIIAYCSTFATRAKHNKLLLIISVLLGFISMYAWTLLFQYMELDFRVSLLFSFIIFGIGQAACIATVSPRSEHYYLKVQGATKGMDIALYKWFRNSPSRVVTIGKSVDCSLQLSWDIQGNVAPIQAEIRLKRQTPYLIPLEPGVFLYGKPAKVNKKIRLHHGRTFTIGQTTFTYIEKDR